jgi:hypothetical protein
MSRWVEFNIHNRVTMRVAEDAPTLSLLMDMFACFLTKEKLDHHDLTITGEVVPMPGAAYGGTDYRYTPTSLYLNAMNVQIVRTEDGFVLNGTRELLVAALPLIDRLMVERSAAMIHAATVEYRGHGICLPAWGGVGKTSTMAKLLKRDGVAFMGDDWAFLSDEAQLLGFAKPLFIKPYHGPIYPHLFGARRKPLVPYRLAEPLARFSTLVHPLVTQYPRLARVSRRWSPEHMMVQPRTAFPQARFSTRAPLAMAIFVERYEGTSALLEEKDRPWMVARMVGNFQAEMTRHSQEVITALGTTSLVPVERTFGDKAAIIDRALEGKPLFLLQIPKAWSADQASDVIVARLQDIFAATGVDEPLDAAFGDRASAFGGPPQTGQTPNAKRQTPSAT